MAHMCNIVHTVQVLPPISIIQVAPLSTFHQQWLVIADSNVGSIVLQALPQSIFTRGAATASNSAVAVHCAAIAGNIEQVATATAVVAAGGAAAKVNAVG
jgi:hypothetical protein